MGPGGSLVEHRPAWATLGGLAIGAFGAATGRLVVYLRSHHEAVGLDEFLGLGLVGMAYGWPSSSGLRLSRRLRRGLACSGSGR
jgi:hypothetical protein